jgi:large subunit ribosomal protein L29
MAIGSKDLASTELRGLDDERLVDELRKAKEELFNLRFQSATGQLDNHGRLRAVRKDIARIYTVLTERALGITDEVEETVEADAAPEAGTDEADDSEKAGSKA